MDLNLIWFLLIAVLLTGYAVLDGFDFGVGIIHMRAKSEEERRININAIGPVWDGNEVWLLTGGGALFAAFPVVYASVFSGMYLALMLLLLALICRAVSLEFRGKVETAAWKKLWDYAFSFGSFVPALLCGVAMGNILRGLPVAADGTLNATFLSLLNPYALLIGLLSLSICIMHGALYLAGKTEAEQQERMKATANKAWITSIILTLCSVWATFFVSPFLFDNVLKTPWSVLFLILLFVGIVFLPMALHADKFLRAFLASCLFIIGLCGFTALALFPTMLPSTIDLAYSLTAYNASSTPKTLFTMLIIAAIGVPLVLIYTAFIYRVFKGKVIITQDSY